MEIIKRLKKSIANFLPEENSGQSLVQKTNLYMSQTDRIRQMIRHEMFAKAIANQEAETFEEADDFDLEDDEPWVSKYDETFDPPPTETPAPPAKPVPTPPPAAPDPDNTSAA